MDYNTRIIISSNYVLYKNDHNDKNNKKNSIIISKKVLIKVEYRYTLSNDTNYNYPYIFICINNVIILIIFQRYYIITNNIILKLNLKLWEFAILVLLLKILICLH